MGNPRTIWKHEVTLTKKIARSLVDSRAANFSRKPGISPHALYNYLRARKDQRMLRRNLLFTKKLAFNGAKEIANGQDPAMALRLIEIKTGEILDNEKRGFYTEKVRRKQLHEIALLLDHYLALMRASAATYPELLRTVYPSRNAYLTFLKKLHELEKQVIEASITSTRKGSKTERVRWFAKVRAQAEKARLEEVTVLFKED